MSVPPKLGAMARMRAAMAKLKPTPGDAKSDLLVVIASRLIMNSGNPVRVSDVLNASSCAPADAWVARAFWELNEAKMPKVWMLSDTPPPRARSTMPSWSICAAWIRPRLPAAQAPPRQ